MMLRTRALVTGALIAAPVAALAVMAMDRSRARDLELALGTRRAVAGQRAGARAVRKRSPVVPDGTARRPSAPRRSRRSQSGRAATAAEGQPAAVRALRVRRAVRRIELRGAAVSPRHAPAASGQRCRKRSPPTRPRSARVSRLPMPTGWIGGPCMYFLGTHGAATRSVVGAHAGSSSHRFSSRLVSRSPRRRRWCCAFASCQRLAREAKKDGFSTVALDGRKDELNAVTFVYNDAVNELRLRKARVDDLDAGLRRFVQSTEDDVATPLRALERTLALAAPQPGEPTALVQAHDLAARVRQPDRRGEASHERVGRRDRSAWIWPRSSRAWSPVTSRSPGQGRSRSR